MQSGQLRRREFITLISGAAVAWPFAARAQQPDRMRRVGVLTAMSETDPTLPPRMAAFQKGLQAFGWAEGRNVSIVYRHATSDLDRLKSAALELVAAAPELIVVWSNPAVIAITVVAQTGEEFALLLRTPGIICLDGPMRKKLSAAASSVASGQGPPPARVRLKRVNCNELTPFLEPRSVRGFFYSASVHEPNRQPSRWSAACSSGDSDPHAAHAVSGHHLQDLVRSHYPLVPNAKVHAPPRTKVAV